MNFSVRELESLRPRLRDGLKFTIQEQGAERVCVIEDPAASRFFRVGFGEYRFFRSLDGTEPVAVLLARLARDAGGEGFNEAEAMQMLRWLKENHLLAVDSSRKEKNTGDARRAWQAAITWMNPIVIRVPLARPDRFFATLATLLRPFLGWFGFALWAALLLIAAAQLAVEWPRFQQGFEGILGRDNWLWLIVVWLGLKVFHECGHGVYCRHFGAPVREVGAMLILFLPMGYVDATASIGLPSRWRRIMVSCAGVYVEFAIAAVAALFWVNTPDSPTATVLHNVVVMGTIVTLFFNGNPLMRFDGYYVLSDVAGIPNLATRARTWVMGLLGWLLLGARRLLPGRPDSPREWFIVVYGIASWLWQLLVFAGLLLAATMLFRGGGVVFAVIAALAWASAPLMAFAREVAGWMRRGFGAALPFAGRMLLLGAVGSAILLFPYQKTVIAHGVVEFADTRVLRAECPGFVDKIHVRDGDLVEQGALLVELRNDEATFEVTEARLKMEAQQRRARLAYTRGEVAEHQAEQARVDGLAKVLREKEAFVETLKIRAPMAGRISGRELSRSEGKYFERGAEVLRVGESQGREVKIAVSQDAEPHFRSGSQLPVQIRIDGRSAKFPGVLERMDDQASSIPPHPALTAVAGGPLPVRRSEHAEQTQIPFELAEPHFLARVRIGGEAAMLADGEVSRVKFSSNRSVTLFDEARRAFQRWVRKFGAS